MAGRGQPRVSLFPFMSVLACTIGALTLLLVAMSLSAVGRTDAATRAYVETKRLTVAERQELDAELERLKLAEDLWAQVDEALLARGLAPGIAQSTIDREIERAGRQAVAVLELAELE
jgi:cell division protein FtsL